MKYLSLLIISITMVSCLTEPKKEGTTGFESNAVDVISSGSPVVDSEKSVDTLSIVENKTIKNTIVLFDNVNDIYPGETSLNEVKAIMGEPDFIDQTKIEVYNGHISGGDKLVKYLKNGIMLIFEREDVNMSVVDAVLVEKGFDGISEEGIYLGMTKENCLAILNKKYFLEDDMGGESMFYSEKEGAEGDLQIWFKNGKLDKLKIFK
ncbi:hypothetical protein [Flavobacterium sp.]|uniref:hypothetical protein n=1 Tax=Flavobacterium sp. TaxID=239 RepID=UPI002BF7E678|nr:hypothetical protein [Flavobacterium sp.]HSD09306.1 hypothetical protein [Flavobacterium sp.]